MLVWIKCSYGYPNARTAGTLCPGTIAEGGDSEGVFFLRKFLPSTERTSIFFVWWCFRCR